MGQGLQGLNMDRQLLLSGLLEYAAGFHGHVEVVSCDATGARRRSCYAEVDDRARRLAAALAALGVGRGDRVATLAWNDHRHYEAYFGITGMGAVLHTINPRLFEDQLAYIVDHAEDAVILVDPSFLPLAERLAGRLPGVRHWVVLGADTAGAALPGVAAYEELLAAHAPLPRWAELEERSAAALCYTSGTTGNPKGVLYSHRALVLQTLRVCSLDGHAVSAQDTILQVVPMFHVNGWTLPFASAMSGAKIVLPGPRVDPETLCDWIDQEQVTFSAGVPTVWLGLAQHLERTGRRVDSLRRISIGGSSAPLALVALLEERYGVEVRHVWGMTEMTLGTAGGPAHDEAGLPLEERRRRKVKAGRVMYGVELEIVDDDGRPLPHDGVARGELLTRGPWVAGAYYRDEHGGAHTTDGWLRTGDVATMDPQGFVEIVDRTKDMIKSGGEWISSIALENLAVGCPGVAEAAVIGLPHPTWQERPLLVVVRQPGHPVTAEQVLAHMAAHLARWQLPDEVVFVEDLPHTGTGKLHKVELRRRFAGHVLASAREAAGPA